MAIQTQRVVSFADETIVLSFDWDDTDGSVVLGRCVNTNWSLAVHIILEGKGTGAAGRGFEQTFAAQSGTTEVAIPLGQQPAYPLGTDPRSGEPTVTGWRMRAETVLG